jgi:hypothetical protein
MKALLLVLLLNSCYSPCEAPPPMEPDATEPSTDDGTECSVLST